MSKQQRDAIDAALRAEPFGQVRFHRTADGRVCAISLFDATFARLDPVVAGWPREGHGRRGHGTR